MVKRVKSWMALRERYIFPALFILLDYCVILLTEWEALWAHDLIRHLPVPYRLSPQFIYFWVPLVFVAFLGQARAYRSMQPILETVKAVFYSVCAAALTCLVIIYFTKTGPLTSRLFFGLFCIFVLFNIYVAKYLLLKFLKKSHLLSAPVLLVGAGKTAERVLRFFQEDLGYRYNVVGIIDDAPVAPQIAERYGLCGRFDEAERIVQETGVKDVIITAPGLTRDKLTELITRIQPHVRNLSFVPDLIGTPVSGVEPHVLFSEEILMLAIHNNLAIRRNRIIKRLFDLVCTIFGGLLLSPVLLLLALVVAIENHGHVIFTHMRIGKDGKPFPCYKFQTMVPDAEKKLAAYLAANPEAKREWEESFKLTHDPRVTKLGAFLRRTSLDELPQIFNVLRGEMSLVGPRPIVREEIPRYGDKFREYAMVLPGITGMWQTSGRSDTTYEERVEMDTWYVRNWSLWIDLVYLFKTFKAVFFAKGAY